MKKRCLIVFVFIFMLYPLSQGNSEEKKYLSIDGYEWASMEKLQRLSFVMGWLQASHVAFVAILNLQMEILNPARLSSRIKNVDQFSECWKRECWSKFAFKAMEANGLNLENLTLGQISDTISKIYSDPRVKKWEIYRIMPIVYGRLNKGWTEKEIDEVIAFYIKHDDFNERTRNYSSKSETERNRINDEYYSLWENEPKVLKTLEEYE